MSTASTYGWIITQDHISVAGELSAVGVSGPRNISDERLTALKLGHTQQAGVTAFRMKDDDDNIYYRGLFSGDADSEQAFGPLDDYGRPNAGCTSIEYFRDGKWEAL